VKIYLAGPDVFRPDAKQWAEQSRELCRRYGFEPLTPMDPPETGNPSEIFQANIALIRKAQIVVANLNPFRGAEPDSGTCFELGYAAGLGKKLFGYVSSGETVVVRVRRIEGAETPLSPTGHPIDRHGYHIEDFQLSHNLMLSMSVQIVFGELEDCLKAIRPRSAT
jgi:nucleoside 2-deoxyribosyltransferase